jgi:DNA segregation ATPase FtsK/SpoIIIE-like protein
MGNAARSAGKKREGFGKRGRPLSLGRKLDEDQLYGEAESLARSAGKVSTAFLQRRLGIGYARSARLVDMLEEKGVIEPGKGAKPRKVIENK